MNFGCWKLFVASNIQISAAGVAELDLGIKEIVVSSRIQKSAAGTAEFRTLSLGINIFYFVVKKIMAPPQNASAEIRIARS